MGKLGESVSDGKVLDSVLRVRRAWEAGMQDSLPDMGLYPYYPQTQHDT
jgi:hypothetical protein